MQVKEPQSEYVEATLPQNIATVEIAAPGQITTVANTEQSDNKESEIGRTISELIARASQNIGNFVNEYPLPVFSFAVLVIGVIVLRILLAITEALNGIPLVASFFELIGFGYVTWLVSRYAIKAINRQKLT
ncbi:MULTISPECIES: CAAD domain-containing protein [Calothrix]|uniref:CAAD domain-containing protein n=2 Tax=Calothrix TaxID=1186 RepID=A0ABR8A9S3_9CYAN|nr:MULTISPECIES: CAAD domain-containing protein [Calothrix]MBD2196745.1 CAAD domain-containing protein [Calothrix parietina FACHB-288]MBD2224155.1 CAAD domain-containing protein [Calothrix anomala FACHB-343]